MPKKVLVIPIQYINLHSSSQPFVIAQHKIAHRQVPSNHPPNDCFRVRNALDWSPTQFYFRPVHAGIHPNKDLGPRNSETANIEESGHAGDSTKDITKYLEWQIQQRCLQYVQYPHHKYLRKQSRYNLKNGTQSMCM